MTTTTWDGLPVSDTDPRGACVILSRHRLRRSRVRTSNTEMPRRSGKVEKREMKPYVERDSNAWNKHAGNLFFASPYISPVSNHGRPRRARILPAMNSQEKPL